ERWQHRPVPDRRHVHRRAGIPAVRVRLRRDRRLDAVRADPHRRAHQLLARPADRRFPMTAIAQTQRPSRARTRDRRDPFRATPLTKAALIFTIFLSVFPLYWMVVIASRTTAQAVDVPPPLLPGGNLGENIQRVFATENANFITGLTNSLIVSSTVTVSVVLISTMAGFAFARLRFRGSKLLLGSILLTMMVPIQQMGVVPLYQLMVELEWTGTLQAVILPFLLNGFGVFLMTQYTEQAVPYELVE